MRICLALGLASMASPALGWGMFGHQITATIAQIYLLPSTHKAICDILLGTYKCNLAGVASWPDEIKQDKFYNEYARLHFVNDADDDPPKKCVFGDSNWKDKNHVLKGIVDMVREVTSANNSSTFPNRDHALRFLVHFLGDIHQPFHLTGQYRGANQVLVTWQGRETNLHFVWDDSFIDHQVLFVNSSDYTSVLPTDSSEDAERNQRIEAALKGLNYDPYIRYILLEGVYKRWTRDVLEWITCPETNVMDLDLGPGLGQSILGNFSARFQDPTDLATVCPLHWANQTHPMLCGGIWPKGLTDKTPREELSGDYATSIREGLIIEKQLAMGGVRLASVLNGLFGTSEDIETYGIIPFP